MMIMCTNSRLVKCGVSTCVRADVGKVSFCCFFGRTLGR